MLAEVAVVAVVVVALVYTEVEWGESEVVGVPPLKRKPTRPFIDSARFTYHSPARCAFAFQLQRGW
jgi:hypothetical protein